MLQHAVVKYTAPGAPTPTNSSMQDRALAICCRPLEMGNIALHIPTSSCCESNVIIILDGMCLLEHLVNKVAAYLLGSSNYKTVMLQQDCEPGQ